MVGYCIYMAVAVCCMVSFFYFKIIKKKSWENVSVRNGLLIVKAAMLVSGPTGPFVYFCLCLQFYSFALIVNHRRDSKPGATFPIQIFFPFSLIMQRKKNFIIPAISRLRNWRICVLSWKKI